MRKRSNYRPKPIKLPPISPKVELTQTQINDLALRAHLAAIRLDTEDGLNEFITVVAKTTIGMELAGTMDDHARAILRTATGHLDSILKTGRISDRQEVYLKRTAAFITDWLDEKRLTFDGLHRATKAMRNIDAKIMRKTD